MTNYKIFKPIKEGDSVQYVGVYVLEWKKEWGRPEVGFAEIEELPNSSGGYLDALLDAIQIAYDEIEPAQNAHHNRIGLLKGAAFSDGYLEGKRAGLQEAIRIIKKSI